MSLDRRTFIESTSALSAIAMVSGEEGLRDLLAIEAIYESILSGQRVNVKHIG